MKKTQFAFILCCFTILVKAQQNQGTVDYKIVNIDTINNIIIQQDSVYSTFVFKPNKTKWEMGFLNSIEVTKTITNNDDYYVIIDHLSEKTALHGEMPDERSFNQLLNYKDTSLIIIKTTITKTIAGRDCKKMYLKFGLLSPVMVLWYDETVNCNSIIPGAGVNGKNINGLILEYEIPNIYGKSIITANRINFEDVANSQFDPNLTGYVITELEREDGSKCSGHH